MLKRIKTIGKNTIRLNESHLKKIITESKTGKNMKKNVVKINENALRQIVAESVKKVLNERTYNPATLAEYYKVRDYGKCVDALKSMDESFKAQVEKVAGCSIDDILQHWYAFNQALYKIMGAYYSAPENDDKGYHDWR